MFAGAFGCLIALASVPCVHAQPASELQKLFGGGKSVAIAGEWAFSQSIVFHFQDGVWSRHQFVSPHDGQSGAGFSSSLALDGDTLVVGAPFDDHSGLDDAGSAYVFQRDPDTNQWLEVQKLTASDADDEDVFGWSVAIEGDLIAVGAPNHDNLGDLWQAWSGFGAAYIFERIDNVWVQAGQVAMLGERERGDGFGLAVAAVNGHAIVGAPWDDIDFGGNTLVDAGSAWTARKFAQQWLTGQMIIGTTPDDGDLFGQPLAAQPDLLAIGAVSDDIGASDHGAVYLLRPDGFNWAHDVRIDGGSSNTFFSRSIALGDGILAVAAQPDDDEDELIDDERVHIFRLQKGAWSQTDIVRPIDRPVFPNDNPHNFGFACALSGETLLVGAPLDDELGTNAGAAYVFDLSGQSGTRAILTDVAVQFGTPIGVTLNLLKTSEDARATIRSQFGFTAQDPNLAELRIGAQNHVTNPITLDLLIEARMNQSGGTMKVRVRNWNTNNFNQVHQYSIGTTETVEPVSNIPAANYIRASDDRIELSLRSSALATFSIQGFEAQHDFVNVLVHD